VCYDALRSTYYRYGLVRGAQKGLWDLGHRVSQIRHPLVSELRWVKPWPTLANPGWLAVGLQLPIVVQLRVTAFHRPLSSDSQPLLLVPLRPLRESFLRRAANTADRALRRVGLSVSAGDHCTRRAPAEVSPWRV